MKKYVLVSVLIAALGIVVVSILASAVLKTNTVSKKESTPSERKFVTVDFGFTSVHAEMVESDADRNKGLSGREKLEEGEGMLFVFEKPDRYAFWMPDMRFAIDIIWLDENMKVVHIQENATPESYPESFTPSVPALYVLEVPTGFTREKGITEGVTGAIK